MGRAYVRDVQQRYGSCNAGNTNGREVAVEVMGWEVKDDDKDVVVYH